MLNPEQEANLVKQCALTLTLSALRLKEGGQPVFLPKQLQDWRTTVATIEASNLPTSLELNKALEAAREIFKWIDNPATPLAKVKANEWKEVAHNLRAWHFKQYSGLSD
jgi:uncharacterized phage infection (PIP) family protein YhgE